MNAKPEAQAYALYTRHGVAGGSPITYEQFRAFWNDLTIDDQQYWLARFEAGPTELTAEFVASADFAVFQEEDLPLVRRAKAAFR